MSECIKQTTYLKRGRKRHSFLRRRLSKVKTLADLERTYIPEVSKYLQELFPTVNVRGRLFVKSEVSILNRRPDFVLYIPNVAIVLLEYKTSNVTLNVRQTYVKQTTDTMVKFEQCHTEKTRIRKTDNIRLLSLLLIRNSSTRQNKLVCVKCEDIANRPFFW